MEEPAARAPDERDTSTMVFLSLFLLVLAFFILLTAMSEVNERSSLDIIQAVKESFSGDETTNLPTTRQRLDAEADAAARKLAADLKALFDRDLPGARTALNDDRVLLVRFPQSELFSRERPTVRRTRLPLVRQVAGLVQATPPGVHHRLELSLPNPGADAAAQQLAVARLGHLATAFNAEGAAPPEMSVALRPPGAQLLDGNTDDAFMQVLTFVDEPEAFVSFGPRRRTAGDGAAGAGPSGGAGQGPVLNLRLDGAPSGNAPADAQPAGAGGG